MSHKQIVGLRFGGETTLAYHAVATDGERIQPGDWIVVGGRDSGVSALVVLTDDQLVSSDLRNLEPSSLDRITAIDLPSREPVDGKEISHERGTQQGFGGPGTPSRNVSSEMATSREDALYRFLKSRYPPLGKRVSTPAGEAIVIAVDIRTSIVTTRSSSDPEPRSWRLDQLSGGIVADRDCSEPL